MARVRRIPLAWNNLAHDRVRFVLFASGIAFAVVLMGVQLGIMHAMLDGNTLLLSRINADLIFVNPERPALLFTQGFNRRRLEQAQGVAGVASAHAIYVDNQTGYLRHTAADPHERAQTRSLRVIGVDPDARMLDLPNLDSDSWDRLKTLGTALYDRKSRPAPQAHAAGETVFGRLAPGVHTELAGQKITLVGGFNLGFDFSTDGTLVVSERTFSHDLRQPYYPFSPMTQVDLGGVRVQPGANILDVQHQLRRVVGAEGDVLVLTKDEMIHREKMFWWGSTPIGFAFGAGVVLGFVVGVVICYQILSSDVADHFAEYATLKAIGYPNRYLSFVVLQESLILAAAGFVPGFVITAGAYLFLADMSSMPLRFTPGRFALLLGLTVVMCVASGLLAVGKVKKVDPADVF